MNLYIAEGSHGIEAAGAEGDANTDFADALGYRVGHHSVEADDPEKSGHGRISQNRGRNLVTAKTLGALYRTILLLELDMVS